MRTTRTMVTTQPWPIDASDGLLEVMVGPPAAGKTSWCLAELAAGRLGTRLCLDDARAELGDGSHDQSVTPRAVDQVRRRVDELLGAGAKVTVDATSTTAAERDTWLTLARKHNVPAIAVIVWEPLDVVLERNRRRDRPVPENVVCEYWRRITGLSVNALLEEGFRGVAELVPESVGARR